jgi:hypothetical protein
MVSYSKLVAYSTRGEPWNQSEQDGEDETCFNVFQIKFCVHFSPSGLRLYIPSPWATNVVDRVQMESYVAQAEEFGPQKICCD